MADPAAITAEVAEAFAGRGEISWTDGLLVSGPDWWLSVRESNTEPLLRLNVEAPDQDLVDRLRDEALRIIRKEA